MHKHLVWANLSSDLLLSMIVTMLALTQIITRDMAYGLLLGLCAMTISANCVILLLFKVPLCQNSETVK